MPATTLPTNAFLNLHVPTHWPAQTDVMAWCQTVGPGEAAVMVLLGVIYLLFGINIYKVLVMINGAMLGAVLGAWIGDRGGNAPVGAAVGGITAAMIAFPLMKHSVAIMAGITGALVGAGLWRLFSPHPEVYWVGGMCGGIVFGLLSFQIFRGCVMTYTSLQGATMLMIGVLALATKYNELSPKMAAAVKTKPFILPIVLFLATLLGLIYQQTPSAAAAAAAKKK